MTQEGTKTYAYNGAGRMASVGGSNSGTYRYDALGQRIKKTYTYTSQSGTISGSIISVYGTGGALLVEYKTETGPTGSNNSRTNYIVNGSQAVARRVIPESGSASTEYLHRNHLSQVVKPSDFSVGFGASSMYGMPFGSGGNDQFAGHKNDSESGLHYNLARSYNPMSSRWQSADSMTTTIYDPQSLNKYSYDRNDPINKIDQNGMFWGEIWEALKAIYGTMALWDWGTRPFNPFEVPLIPTEDWLDPLMNQNSPGGAGVVDPQFPTLVGSEKERAERAISLAKEWTKNPNCNSALSTYNVSIGLSETLGNVNININTFRGWTSSFPDTTYGTIHQAFYRNINTIAALTNIQEASPNTIFLGPGFFNPSSLGVDTMFEVQARTIIILHESVHLTTGLNDDWFGGSQALTKAIVDNCFPEISSYMGRLYQ